MNELRQEQRAIYLGEFDQVKPIKASKHHALCLCLRSNQYINIRLYDENKRISYAEYLVTPGNVNYQDALNEFSRLFYENAITWINGKPLNLVQVQEIIENGVSININSLRWQELPFPYENKRQNDSDNKRSSTWAQMLNHDIDKDQVQKDFNESSFNSQFMLNHKNQSNVKLHV